jgi:hypothetical protein
MMCVNNPVDFLREGFSGAQAVLKKFRRLAAGCLAVVFLSAAPAMAQLEPIAYDDFLGVQQDLFETADVLMNDSVRDWGTAENPNNIEPWSVAIVMQPSHGQVIVDPQTGAAFYEPDLGYYGGDIFAYQFRDTYGRLSNVGYVFVDVVRVNRSPFLASFTATNPNGNIWVFTGTVTDDVMSGLKIAFGGPLAGHEVTVAADGTFSYTVYIDPNNSGLVSAVAVDSDFAVSNERYYTVT